MKNIENSAIKLASISALTIAGITGLSPEKVDAQSQYRNPEHPRPTHETQHRPQYNNKIRDFREQYVEHHRNNYPRQNHQPPQYQQPNYNNPNIRCIRVRDQHGNIRIINRY